MKLNEISTGHYLNQIKSNIPRFLAGCYTYASLTSHDPKTQIGACVVHIPNGEVLCYGTNHLINGDYLDKNGNRVPINSKSHLTLGIEKIRDLPILHTTEKYSCMVHAEVDAIQNFTAKYSHINVNEVALVCPYFACLECSKFIVKNKFKYIIGHKEMLDKTPDRWKSSIQNGRNLFDESMVEYFEWSGRIYGYQSILMNGEIFIP